MDKSDEAASEAAIKQLGVDAALATDAITSGDIAGAVARFRAAFSEDAVIAAGFDRDAPLLSAVGPDAWAESVAAAYTTYSASQHLLGTCNVTFDEGGGGRGGVARMTTYLHATFVVAASTGVLTVTGTYRDVVRRGDDGWRITERFLLFTSFSSGVRDAPPPATEPAR
jgi:SnoaL-like domain